MIPLVPSPPRLVVSVALAAVGKVKGEAVGREKLMMHVVQLQPEGTAEKMTWWRVQSLTTPSLELWFC